MLTWFIKLDGGIQKMDQTIQTWINGIQKLTLPRWDDLPDIELYLDQVLSYVNKELQVVFLRNKNQKDDIVTASMINNYVKNKIMKAPIKKKYRRSHLAFIITITILKNVGSLNDVSHGIRHLTSVLGASDAYNTFITYLENALQTASKELNGKPDPSYYLTQVSVDLLPLKTATIAFASIMLSNYLFSNISHTNKGA